MNLAVFTVDKQDVDSHLQVDDFVCDVIHDILEPFHYISILFHYRNIFLLIIDISEFLTSLLSITFCSILLKVTDVNVFIDENYKEKILKLLPVLY